MKKQKLLEIAQNDFEGIKTVLDLIPDEIEELDVVSSVSNGGYVYLETVDTFKEHLELLRTFAKHFGKYEVSYYNVSCGSLAMRYEFELIGDHNLSVYFYCREMNVALESVGKGKCKIVEEYSTPYKRQSVVCDA